MPLAAPSGISWHAKDFAMSPEVDPDAGVKQLGLYGGFGCAHEYSDVLRRFTMFTITPELWS